MKISAIIPAYNAERYLERAVKSLINTKYPDLEIVIVNDGSTDETEDIAKRLTLAYSEVRAFNHEGCKNHGVSASRNLGLARCSGDLVCFLDADDYVLPHRFDVAVALLATNPEIDAVHELARMEFEQGKGGEKFWDQDELFGIRAKSMEVCSFLAILKGVCWNPAAILLRKEFLGKTGSFPEDFRFAEDYHLWLRMVCSGTVVAGNDIEPVSVYYRHAENVYKGGLERKDDVIRAMTEVYCWLKSNGGDQVDKRQFSKAVCQYIYNALVRSREEQRCDIGRKFVLTAVGNKFLSIFLDKKLLRQILWVLVGRNAKYNSAAHI